jgi:RNA polymerase sigma factor (sigma-70 family)
MENKLHLVDRTGRDLEPEVARVLEELWHVFVRKFPDLEDDPLLQEAIEEGGRCIQDRLAQGAEIRNLPGYAMRVIVNLVLKRRAAAQYRFEHGMIAGKAAEIACIQAESARGNGKVIFDRVLLQELREHLSEDERLVVAWRQIGRSSEEIGRQLGKRSGAIDVMHQRALEKMRKVANGRSGR